MIKNDNQKQNVLIQFPRELREKVRTEANKLSLTESAFVRLATINYMKQND